MTAHVAPGLTRGPFFPISISDNPLQISRLLREELNQALTENIQMPKHPCVYIITNPPRGTLYIGVTSNLVQRIWQHKNHVVKGFSNEYGLVNLVYYELHGDMYEAITREKSIKNWKRIWKIELIEDFNPEWIDLFSRII